MAETPVSNSTPATIEDVARIAEVSIATVSRAIHTPEKVANSTRLKVNQAIAMTGYTTNAIFTCSTAHSCLALGLPRTSGAAKPSKASS